MFWIFWFFNYDTNEILNNQEELRLYLVQWQLAGFTVYTIILKLWSSSVADRLKSEYVKCHHFSITCNNWNELIKHLLFVRKNKACSSWLTLKTELPHQLKDQDQCLDLINKLTLFLNLSQTLGVFVLMSTQQTVFLHLCLMWGASRLEQTPFSHKCWLKPKVTENNNCHSLSRPHCHFSLIYRCNKWGLVSEIVEGVYSEYENWDCRMSLYATGLSGSV